MNTQTFAAGQRVTFAMTEARYIPAEVVQVGERLVTIKVFRGTEEHVRKVEASRLEAGETVSA